VIGRGDFIPRPVPGVVRTSPARRSGCGQRSSQTLWRSQPLFLLHFLAIACRSNRRHNLVAVVPERSSSLVRTHIWSRHHLGQIGEDTTVICAFPCESKNRPIILNEMSFSGVLVRSKAGKQRMRVRPRQGNEWICWAWLEFLKRQT
jgi:hypothetical protein